MVRELVAFVVVKRSSDHFKRWLSSKNKLLFLQAYYLQLTLFNTIRDYLIRHLVFWGIIHVEVGVKSALS